MFLIMSLAALLFVLCGNWLLRCPPALPDNMVRIPIAVNLISLLKGDNQLQMYQKRLKTVLDAAGVVKMWFGGRWSIIITRPDLLAEVFKNERVYSKAGFRKKVPWGYFAYLFGDNIIDSHGADWKQFMSIMKPGILDKPANRTDIHKKTVKLISLLVERQKFAPKGQGVRIDGFVRRWAININSAHFLDVEMDTLESENSKIDHKYEEVVGVRPLTFLTAFPQLEKYHWIFRGAKRGGEFGFAVADQFEELLLEMVCTRKKPDKNAETSETSKASVIEALEKGYKDGLITHHQFVSNIKTIFIVSHENVQLALNSAIWELAKNQTIQEKLRAEVSMHTGNDEQKIYSMPYLLSVIYEVLRLSPPLFQLTNRVTLEPIVLGGTFSLPAGTWVGWNAYAVHTNTEIWGPTANEFDPERWGSTVEAIETMYRRMQFQGMYIPFNSHARKCLGKGFAMKQLKIALSQIVKALEMKPDPTYKLAAAPTGTMTPVGARIILHVL